MTKIIINRTEKSKTVITYSELKTGDFFSVPDSLNSNHICIKCFNNYSIDLNKKKVITPNDNTAVIKFFEVEVYIVDLL